MGSCAVRRLPRGLVGIVSACSVFLVASCARTDRSTDPGEATNAAVLVDLDDAGEVATWTTVNDPVMGGMSTSTITFAGGGLLFSGTLSLENNGGFASARSPQNPDIGGKATGATSLRVHAQGDGKTYLLKVGITGQPWSYIQRFPTQAGAPEIYDLPVEGFEPVGMRLDPAPNAPPSLEPSLIDEVAIYILDKQRGPFEITVIAVDATT
jgi:Complex I intermediate-associated protein 30 (CIA30)